MTDPGEAAASVLLLFFGGGIILAVYAGFHGGNVLAITDAITTLAVPVTIFAIVVAFAISIANSISGF